MSTVESSAALPWLPFEADPDADRPKPSGGRHRAPPLSTAPAETSASREWTYLALRGVAVAILIWLASLLLWSVAPMATGLSPNLIESGSMTPAIRTGDVVLTAPVARTKIVAVIRPGMVALVDNPARPGRTLLHRVRSVDPSGDLRTKGDANPAVDSTPVPAVDVKGIGRLRVPFVGLPITWVQHGQFIWALISLAAVAALAVAAAHAQVTRVGIAGLVAALALTPLTVIGAHSAGAVFNATTTPGLASGARSGEFPAQGVWWAGDNYWSQAGASDLTSNWSPAAVSSPSSTGWTAVATAYDRTCAIRSPGTMWCWGLTNDNFAIAGRSTAPGLLPAQVGSATTWTAVGVGTDFSCGLQSNNTLWCWGSNYYGQLGIGNNTDQRSPTQVTGSWTKIGVGAYHACAIKSDGSLWCWGANDRYQLGNGSTTVSNTPSRVGSFTDWTSVSGGDAHECGLRGTGLLYCWGFNSNGQVPNGTTTNQSVPVQIGTATNWTTLGLGDFHTCVASTSTVQCAGWNSTGQLGDGTTTDHSSLAPVNIGGANWTSLGADYNTTCGRQSSGTVYCWGGSNWGDQGNGAVYYNPSPAVVTGTWSSVALGGNHGCALTNTGSGLSCWGRNDYGQLGNGRADFPTTADPMPAAAGTNWTTFGIGKEHTCAIKSDGSLWCMGNNYWGNLGQNDTVSRSFPTRVGTGTSWAQVTSNDSTSCAIQTNTTLWCWGWNDYGQLGLGDIAARYLPNQVAGTGWSQVSLGQYGGCAVKLSGLAYCWGDNSYGQLGNGTNTSSLSPLAVSGSNFKSVSYTGYHVCGLKRDNSLSCWGYNYDGELGDTTTTNRNAPVAVGGTWTSVSTGTYYTCGIQTAGSAWCWGYNGSGQLGNGGTASTSTPAQVSGGWTDVTQLASGDQHTCAIRSSSTVYCWGADDLGQLGLGAAAGTGSQLSPVAFSTTANVTRIYLGHSTTMLVTTSQSYEAENAALTHCLASATSNASGGRHVTNMSYTDSAADFTVTPPAAGTYTIKIYYDNGGASATQTLTTNGSANQTVTYPTTSPGYGTEAPTQYATATVTLTSGANHLVLKEATNAVELDRISVG